MLCDVGGLLYGASWTRDGSILFGHTDGCIMRVPEAGGAPEVFVPAEEGERVYGPQMLPGGRHLLFTRTADDWDDARVLVRSLETGKDKTVVARGLDGRYIPTGHLLYAVEETIFVVPFDLDALEATGVPVPAIENVRRARYTGGAQYSLSDNGLLAYVPAAGLIEGRLVWVARSGEVTPLSEKRANYLAPRLSPDGARLAVQIDDDLWIHGIGTDTTSRFTTDGIYRAPVWSPDGVTLTYASGPLDVENTGFRKPSDFSGPAEPIGISGIPHAWTPDGKRLVFSSFDGESSDIWVYSSNGELEPLVRTRAWETGAAISPDGRWIAFSSNESGRSEIYVQPFPGPGKRSMVSVGGGTNPVWSPSLRELFYVEDFQRLMTVDIAAEPDFRAGKPRALFEREFPPSPFRRPYDVAPDGQRFVMVEGGAEAPSRQQINVVLSWFDELERLTSRGSGSER
jgi:serine/threonine-protein kinase